MATCLRRTARACLAVALLMPHLHVLNVLQAGRSKEVTLAAAGWVCAAIAGAASKPDTGCHNAHHWPKEGLKAFEVATAFPTCPLQPSEAFAAI